MENNSDPLRPDGTRRTRDEALKLVGHRAVWVAELNEALEARLAGPPILSVPRRLFLSYRWGTDEENAWVVDLVQELRKRGYVVVFDRTDKPAEIDVPRFVARLADCHWFVAVLDPGYEERIGTGDASGRTFDGWVFDEFNTAASLSNAGRMQIIGLLRAGDRLPRGFAFPGPATLGNAVDVRAPERLTAVLEQLFPPMRDVPPPAILDEVGRLIGASHDAIQAGDFETAIELAGRAAEACPEIADGHAQLLRATVPAGRSRDGLAAARKALAIDPRACELWMMAAACAYREGEIGFAAQYCVAILERSSDPRLHSELPAAHYYLGNVLDDAGVSHAGIAHLEIARRLAPDRPTFHNDLGFAYRHVNDIQRALACFDEGLKVATDDTRLLVNQAATLIEAGDSARSRSALERLAAVQPDHPAIPALTDVLDRWQSGGGEPPVLVPRIAQPSHAGVVSCDKCAAQVPIESERVSLCAACGAPRSNPGDRCAICGHDGLVPAALAALEPVHLLCPYCRTGQVKFTRIPQSGTGIA